MLAFRESSSENNQVYARVAEAVFQDYGGEDKCPWSKQLLKGTWNIKSRCFMKL